MNIAVLIMIQLTVEPISSIVRMEDIFVATNKDCKVLIYQ